MSHKINIIYFIWINPNRNWRVIIDGQLFDMKVSGIFEFSKLYIVISCENNNIINEAINLINSSLIDIDINKYNIITTNYNNYEYDGIKKMYDISLSEPDKLYIYLHSKGMLNWYNNNPNKRSEDEENLTKNTIYLWRDIVDVFEKNKNINKIGFIPAQDGWIWFNFFWTRGTYLITCENPIITNNRYYYESWLNSGDKNNGISYGIYSHDYKTYSAFEAIDIITKIR
jgi:hypothetical protein